MKTQSANSATRPAAIKKEENLKKSFHMSKEIKIESNLYNDIQYVFGVDLQILTNTITGEQSIGWTREGSELSNIWRLELENGEESQF